MFKEIIIASVSTIPLLVYYLAKHNYKKKLEKLDEANPYYYHLISVNMTNFDCRQHVVDRIECNEETCSYVYLNKLIKFISSAETSISVCMYISTSRNVNYALIMAHRRGVNVRVITDKGMFETKAIQNNIQKLKESGVPFKVQPVRHNMMHHKFCLIDEEDVQKAKLLFGSLNITLQGLTSNFDNVILTNNLGIIERFSDEFEELWNLF